MHKNKIKMGLLRKWLFSDIGQETLGWSFLTKNWIGQLKFYSEYLSCSNTQLWGIMDWFLFLNNKMPSTITSLGFLQGSSYLKMLIKVLDTREHFLRLTATKRGAKSSGYGKMVSKNLWLPSSIFFKFFFQKWLRK